MSNRSNLWTWAKTEVIWQSIFFAFKKGFCRLLLGLLPSPVIRNRKNENL